MGKIILATFLVLSTFVAQSAFATSPTIPPTNPMDLIGVWNNTNPATGNIVRVIIRPAGTGVTVQPFGACSPTPCDHGILSARTFSNGVASKNAIGFHSAKNFGFKITSYDGIRRGTGLVLLTQNTFVAGDTRFNYTMMETYVRSPLVDGSSADPIDVETPADHASNTDIN